MVLERLFPEDWLERKFIFAFILGFVYSVIGIIIAKILFPANSGIVSVIFTSIFLTPSMRKIFSKEEASEEKSKKFSMKRLYKLDYDVVFMYFLIFFGIFLAYLLFSFLMPQLGVSTFNILKEQFFLDSSLRGRASFDSSSFLSIFYNNWWILLATFMLALIAGDGAIFFVAWNASAWGAIFGIRALQASLYTGQDAFIVLFQLLAIVVWHMTLEGGAYILAGIAGSTISSKIIKEKLEIEEFVIWLIAAVFVFLVGKYIIGMMFLGVMAKFALYFLLMLGLLHFLGNIVAEKKNRQVYTYNLALFIIAIAVFMLGVLVEVYVLSNSDALHRIYQFSSCYTYNIPFGKCGF
ncbi:MAG TPA: stage II sporulation protein M [Candidatus Nanoarchaeia archaeon]|nr:stage II sporulation protein M [Candidatus Nanoarchaeia archaeon]